ncbi:cytochrome P450 family protein [Pseudonocardia lacus]|uniref:cytochrome P450 family protein n=1 Tax=Pseudonocardia lacus TaxID=2835865 RepID=UPI001BDDB4EE|nr:cytochrome P450 [Pseudonocardia lacus]
MAEHVAAWGGWGAEVRDDPFPTFARLLATGPVHAVTLADGHEATLVLGHSAARQALKDPRLSKDMQAALSDDTSTVDPGLPGPEFSRHMLGVDPPDHTRLRNLVAAAFTPGRVTGLEPWIQAITDRLLDDLAQRGGVVDLVAGFAHPLPFQVIGRLLGVPDDDLPALHERFATLLAPRAGDPPAEAVEASDAIVAYLRDLVALKQRRPGDDLVSDLARTGGDGERLTRQELLSSLFQLVIAGHDTTTSLIGNSVVALLDHPDQLALLRAEPHRLAGAVEELVRFTAPVPHATFRYATEPVELGGTTVPAGRQVLVSLAAAGRDPAHVDRPHTLDVTRVGRRHLGFGHGIHHCLGARLALLETRVALATLLRRYPGLRLAVPRTELRWSHGDGLVIRGLAKLPVLLGTPGGRP